MFPLVPRTHLPMRGMAWDVAGRRWEISRRKTDWARSTEITRVIFSPPREQVSSGQTLPKVPSSSIPSARLALPVSHDTVPYIGVFCYGSALGSCMGYPVPKCPSARMPGWGDGVLHGDIPVPGCPHAGHCGVGVPQDLVQVWDMEVPRGCDSR